MAAKKQHLLLVNPKENPIQWKYKPRKVTQKPEDSEDKDYTQMANRLEENKRSYILDQEIRVQSRTLTVPGHIDYNQVRFQDQFAPQGMPKKILTLALIHFKLCIVVPFPSNDGQMTGENGNG